MDDNSVMHAMSIDDMYHVEGVLARGVTGVTELVTVEGSGPFVRKKIPLDQANRSVWTACADCGSKRLPQVEAMYELPDEFVVVYDFVPGDSVEALVSSQGALPPEQAVVLVRDVCEAAGALHACGIVHRDISPTNVIVAADGAHLIDLGIARMHKDGASRDDDALGTWGYAAPEQYGFAPTDPRSDVYSIGRLLAYMLTGVAPSGEGFDAALADASRVPPALRAVVDKACSFEPSSRYQSADELSRALDGTHAPEREGEPGSAKSAGAPVAKEAPDKKRQATREAAPPRGGEHRRGAAVIGAVLALAVAGAGVGTFLVVRSDLGDGASTAVNADGASEAKEDASASTNANKVTASDEGEAPSAPAASGTVNASDESGILQVASFEWGLASDGSVVYLVGLTNTNDTLAASFSDVTLTGYDAQGNVTFSNDLFFSTLRPGETLHMAEFNLGAASTVDVEAQVSVPSYGLTRWTGITGDVFEVDHVSPIRDDLGGNAFTGTITTLQDADDGRSLVRVDVVMRDADGNLVGYANEYPDRPAVGKTTSFEALAAVDPGTFASYEVYVSPW